MWRVLVGLWRWVLRRLRGMGGRPAAPPDAPARAFRPIGLARYDDGDSPPPMHWKPCHPRTARRFKAQMTCAMGHPIVLRDHTIRADGTVHPSVVCNASGCQFHAFVVLTGWRDGDIVA